MKKAKQCLLFALMLGFSFFPQNLASQILAIDLGFGAGLGVPNGQLLQRNLLRSSFQKQLALGVQYSLSHKWGIYFQALPSSGTYQPNKFRIQSDCFGTPCLTFQSVNDSVKGRGLILYELPLLIGGTYFFGKGIKLNVMLGANVMLHSKSFVPSDQASNAKSQVMAFVPDHPILYRKTIPVTKFELSKGIPLSKRLGLIIGASAQLSLANRLVIAGYRNYKQDHAFRPNSYFLRLGMKWQSRINN